MSRRVKSLQLRLTLELAALFFVASCLAVGGLIYSASLTAGSLADRELGLRAEDLARYVSLDENRKPRLELPPPLKQAYSAAAQQSLFAIRDKDGHLVEASTPEIGAIIARWPQADSEPSYFRLSKFGPLERDYSGVSIRLDSAAGPLSVLVAEVSGGNQLVHSILREFVFDIAWYVPPFVALALLLAAFSVRRSLLPLRTASAQASAIGPGSIALRLPEADVPTEALPLVIAVNHALDRLEQGFVIQRRFTANAAHELRTPLTIITARLDTLEGNGQLSALREEVARMNRLVEQLLCVARLDSVALDVSLPVDLHATCRGGGRLDGASGVVSLPDDRADRRRSAGPGYWQCCGNCRCAAQSDRKRARAYAAGNRGGRRGRPGGGDQCPGQRSGHPGRGPAAHLRALLARQRGSHRRSRTGFGDRYGDRQGAWRQHNGKRPRPARGALRSPVSNCLKKRSVPLLRSASKIS